MKKRKNKKNGVIAAVVALSGVSLVSVGFASWIISGGDTANVAGSIEADTVTDQRFMIQLHDDYSADGKVAFKNSIVFGPKVESTTYSWLKAGGNETTENLSATAKFWVANIEDGTDQDSTYTNILKKGAENIVKMNALEVDSAHAAAFNKEVNSKRLLAALPTPVLTVNRATTKNNFGDNLTYYEVTATVTFGWGAYFNSQNPYKYFNNQVYSTELGNTANEILKYVYAVNGATYTTTITTGNLIVA